MIGSLCARHFRLCPTPLDLYLNCRQASVSWLTATHIGNWVVKLKPDGKTQRETLSVNWTVMLDLAIENLHKSLWFGIMEDMDKSLELLEYQTGNCRSC